MSSNKNFAVGRCSILINSEAVSADTISELLGVVPTRMVKKGKLLSKALNTYAPRNGWFYDVVCENLEEINVSLQVVAKLCLLCNEKLRAYDDVDIKIRCFINSELAQVGFGISAETLAMLADTHKEFEITMFSWGGAEVDSHESAQ